MAARIAFAKTGWSEEYSGGDVFGRHAHIAEGKEAQERFNFFPASDGKFYAYIPRIGRSSPPKPKETDDWLVIFVAARDGTGPLTVVGWYEHAVFENEYKKRPDESDYLYCVSSDSARQIPAEKRGKIIPSDHFKRTPIVYARGNGMDDEWRQKLAELAEEIVANPEFGVDPKSNSGFPDSAVREAVEKAAIEKAMEYLEDKKYKVVDRQKDNCGYDLLARRKINADELHVEVKGTGGQEMRFFMSRNEKKYMSHPKWRLLVVTNALGKPEVSLLTANQVQARFQFNPLSWEAVLKKS